MPLFKDRRMLLECAAEFSAAFAERGGGGSGAFCACGLGGENLRGSGGCRGGRLGGF